MFKTKFRWSIFSLLIVLTFASAVFWVGVRILTNPSLGQTISNLDSASAGEEKILFRKIKSLSNTVQLSFFDENGKKILPSAVADCSSVVVKITADQYECLHELRDSKNLAELMGE